MTGTSLLTLLLTISVYPYTVLSLVAESSGSLSNHFCLVRRESYRKKRQNTFVVHLSNHEDENTREKESVEKFRSKLEHIYDSEIDYCAEFMKSHPNGVGWHESCAEENEQCEIPDDYKMLPSNSIDVMAFLGIKRAQPIHVDDKNKDSM